MFGVVCPSDDVLGALVHHALEPDEIERVTSHLDDCDACQQIVIAAVRGGVAPDLAPATRKVARQVHLGVASGVIAAGVSRIGRYELRTLLGVGGMGAVYEAHDTELDRNVALKVLRRELCEAPQLADRLVHESRLMAKVAHPSVIRVYDIGRDGDVVFIAMELIRGSTLTAWLASHELEWPDIVALFERAGHGLAAAHSAGIVHRDFKPDNVLVAGDPDKVVVTDFGIARETALSAMEDEATLPGEAALVARVEHRDGPTGGAPRGIDAQMTTDGAVLGTPAYMAPEQIAGQRADHRADVFAFSVSLWEALFGSRPFPGNTVAEIFVAMQQPVVRPTCTTVPRRLVRVLETGLALDPHDRWPDMPAMLARLAAIRAGDKRVALAAGAAGLVALGIAAALAVTHTDPMVDRCARALVPLAEAYNPHLEAQVRAALAGEPKLQGEVLTRLTATADTWRTTHLATCHADREIVQDPQTTACLDARVVELAGSIDDLIAGGAGGAAYATRISKLPAPPSACAIPAPGLLFARVPADRELRRKVTALRNRLSDATDARDRTDYPQALAQAEPVAAAAATLWPPLHAEALYTLGTIRRAGSDINLAVATLLDAAGAAERAHDDETAVKCWTQLVQAVTMENGEPLRGLEYASYGDAALDRIGRPPDKVMRLEYARAYALLGVARYQDAEIAMRKTLDIARTISAEAVSYALDGLGALYEHLGRNTEAIAVFRQAVELFPRTPGRIDDRTTGYQHLAVNLALLGQLEQAEIEARRAVEIADRTMPETQFRRPSAHMTLAEVLQDVGRQDEALAEATQAVDTMEKTTGKRSERYGTALNVRGEILLYLGRYAEAEPLLARACDIMAFAHNDETAASCEVMHAEALIGLRRGAEALAKLDQALPSLTKMYGDSHLEVAKALCARGTAHTGLGHHAAAIADLERTVAILLPKRLEPGYLATARWQLGRALRRIEPARARAEVTAALVLFDTANQRWLVQRHDAAAWLRGRERRHRGP